MGFAEQLRVLEEAQGDPAMLALAAVDLAYLSKDGVERAKIKDGLEAAAIPHWVDEKILAALLDIPRPEAATRLELLQGLNIIEPFPARGQGAINVHDVNRQALRKKIATDDEARFRRLSSRAVACFAADDAPSAQIEWIYHLLCADPDAGADALEALRRDWKITSRPEADFALATALGELEKASLVKDRARIWLLLTVAWVRVSRGDTARLASDATTALELAQQLSDRPAEAEAHALLGLAWEARGKLPEAEAAVRESLRINQLLAEQEPDNANWQRELAIVHGRMGELLQAEGHLAMAQTAFEEDLAISRRLAEQDPDDTGWQRDLAVAYGRVGDVLLAQDNHTLAHTFFEEYLAICRQLAEQDPGNAGWQRELAVAHSKMGDSFKAQGKLAEAQREFEKDLAISCWLVERDPSNAGWQRDLAVTHSKAGDMLEARDKPDLARKAYGEALKIGSRLAEQDPSNAEWQRGLALTQWRIADLELAGDAPEAALPLYEQALAILEALTAEAPEFSEWIDDRERLEAALDQCRALASNEDDQSLD